MGDVLPPSPPPLPSLTWTNTHNWPPVSPPPAVPLSHCKGLETCSQPRGSSLNGLQLSQDKLQVLKV